VVPTNPSRVDGCRRARDSLARNERLGIPLAQVIGVGDAENDQVLLAVCGLEVAVANAVPELKSVTKVKDYDSS
jgi:hydroxymethylpyrimidine pyrophosphatase-like HAD family hydrolase